MICQCSIWVRLNNPARRILLSPEQSRKDATIKTDIVERVLSLGEHAPFFALWHLTRRQVPKRLPMKGTAVGLLHEMYVVLVFGLQRPSSTATVQYSASARRGPLAHQNGPKHGDNHERPDGGYVPRRDLEPKEAPLAIGQRLPRLVMSHCVRSSNRASGSRWSAEEHACRARRHQKVCGANERAYAG